MVGRMSEGHDSDDASDMQMSQSDVDQINEDMDIDEEDAQEETEQADATGDAPEEDEGVDDKDVEVEEDDLPDEASDVDALASSPPPEKQNMDTKSQPRLRIKLKLPASGSVQTALSTPEETGGTSSRREASRDSDIESEEEDEVESEDEEEEEDEEDEDQSTRSASVATSGTASRTLTARQAVLANVVDSSHVSLGERHHPRRRKQLTEMEIALKREETARKRKNLSEKKLEDEKMETINRLLKKQSRGKGRRNALSTAEDKPTPLASTANVADVDAEDGDVANPEPVAPTMYRWISTSRASGADTKGSSDKKMLLSFSIPAVLLPSEEARSAKMDVDEEPRTAQMPECDVQGCTERRKYRLVKDWSRGACGMSHLKLLEAQLS